jgi:hypothetical protein
MALPCLIGTPLEQSFMGGDSPAGAQPPARQNDQHWQQSPHLSTSSMILVGLELKAGKDGAMVNGDDSGMRARLPAALAEKLAEAEQAFGRVPLHVDPTLVAARGRVTCLAMFGPAEA